MRSYSGLEFMWIFLRTFIHFYTPQKLTLFYIPPNFSKKIKETSILRFLLYQKSGIDVLNLKGKRGLKASSLYIPLNIHIFFFLSLEDILRKASVLS